MQNEPSSPYDRAIEETWSGRGQNIEAPNWTLVPIEKNEVMEDGSTHAVTSFPADKVVATATAKENSFSESPEAIHAYILEELGDSELAKRVAEHPEITAQIVSGEGPLSPDFFTMIRAIAKKHSSLAVTLVREAQQHGLLLPTNADIVGVGRRVEDTDQFFLQHIFEINENAVFPYSGEKEKNVFDLSAIEYAGSELQKIRQSYGLPEYAVIPEQVKLLDPSALPPRVMGKHDMYGQQILAGVGEGAHPIDRLSVITHEFVHAHAYGAIEVWRDGQGRQNIAVRRRGLNVRNSKERSGDAFLNGLNEAVTEELTNRMVRDIPEQHPIFGNFIKTRNKNVQQVIEKRQLTPDRYDRPYWYSDPQNGETLTTSYLKEKQLMYYLFEKMYDSAPERFGNMTQEEADEELFSMLTKGAFTGNILPFGRLFNDTFGRGKFREFAHLQTTAEQQRFIEQLGEPEQSGSGAV